MNNKKILFTHSKISGNFENFSGSGLKLLMALDFDGFFNKTLNSDEYSPKLSEKERTIASLFTNNQKILKEQ